jgi:hypothetical protein
MQTGFRLIGAADDPANATRQRALLQSVSPDYFRTLRIPILAGRTFRDDDRVGRPAVVIVNREFVRRFGAGVGQSIETGRPATIVGWWVMSACRPERRRRNRTFT